MGVETRMKEIARKKGMRTATEVEEENLSKIKDGEEKRPGLNYLFNHKGKHIILTLMDNEQIEGILKSFSNYELCVECEENTADLIIYKHAIKYYTEKETEKKAK